ncbi:bifunctional folylpolyglutamate synthase/dihydrofolate synthase [candidate division WOR-3 bacterium]|nr:bifunctional folylpolyglutamate synthase/dihydrofolate synthase [candidate division WOR-3 bacterium]
MTYEDAIAYLYSFVDYEKLTSPSYEKKERSPAKFKRFLSDIGSPEKCFPVIHITGTKGKGSVAMMLTSIFKEMALLVGTYISPHLIDVRERIMLNGHPISREDFLKLFVKILPVIKKRNRNRSYRTVFEILTAIAFLYFKESKIDIGVIEVGLGGKLDATNVFERSTAVITNISLDHTNILGNTLKEIAEDKSEIIKPDSLVVSSPQIEEVMSIIREKSLVRNCKLINTGDYCCTIREKNEDGSVFDVTTDKDEYRDLKLTLLGSFQIENAITAIGVVQEFEYSNIPTFKDVNIDVLKQGLASIYWRGRLEVLRRTPYLIVDGAHNPFSMEILAKEIKDIFNYKRLILIFGVNRDKQIRKMLDAIVPISDEIIFTKIDFPRSAEPALIMNMLVGKSTKISKDIKEALKIAYKTANEEDLILVTGSLYLVGEAIKYVEG